MIPLSPRRAWVSRSRASRVFKVVSPLRNPVSRRFGRKKLPRTWTGSVIASCSTMSRVTSGVAVAVSASTGTPAEPAFQPGQVAVGGPEVVAPLADAMGFVHGDEAGADPRQGVAHPPLEPLGRGVDQLVVPGAQGGLPLAPVLQREAGVQEGGPHAQLGQGVDLVLHQRDERGDHQGGAAQQPGGDLVGQRLARPGRHDPHAVAAGQHGADHGVLPRAEPLVPVGLLQHLLGGREVEVGRARVRR